MGASNASSDGNTSGTPVPEHSPWSGKPWFNTHGDPNTGGWEVGEKSTCGTGGKAEVGPLTGTRPSSGGWGSSNAGGSTPIEAQSVASGDNASWTTPESAATYRSGWHSVPAVPKQLSEASSGSATGQQQQPKHYPVQSTDPWRNDDDNDDKPPGMVDSEDEERKARAHLKGRREPE